MCITKLSPIQGSLKMFYNKRTNILLKARLSNWEAVLRNWKTPVLLREKKTILQDCPDLVVSGKFPVCMEFFTECTESFQTVLKPSRFSEIL